MNRIIPLTCLGIVLFALTVGAAWLRLQAWAREKLLADVDQALGTRVEAKDFGLDLLSGRLEARRIKLHNLRPEIPWQSATIDRLAASISILDLFSSHIPVAVELDGVEIKTQPSNSTASPPATSSSPTKPLHTPPAWPRFQVRKITAQNLSLVSSTLPIAFERTEATAELKADGTSWTGHVRAPALSLHPYSFGPCQCEFTLAGGRWTVQAFSLQAGQGQISGRAEFPEAFHQPGTVDFNLQRVPISLLLPSKWQVIFQGFASGSGTYTGPALDWKQGETRAKLTFEEAQLQSLPLLEKLALLPGLAGMASVSLDQARTELHHREGTTTLSPLAVTKMNTLSWQGNIVVHPDGRLEGTTMLGLPSGAMGLLPPLRAKIFTMDQDGYAWTPVKLSGTAEKIEEDLTPRLAALAQDSSGQALEQGKGILQEGVHKAGKWLDEWLKK